VDLNSKVVNSQPPALCRPEDLPRRTVDEAGPDEHGLLHREPSAIPRKLRGKHGKYIIKKAVEDLLPRSIIYRTKKGFPTPVTDWLMRDQAKAIREYLRDPDGVLAAYVNPVYLDDLLEKHDRGIHDATDRIWRLLNLQVWGDMYLTGRREQFWEGLMPMSANSVQVA
jgi:asparagine synthase (glutamine-hydrolysing)